MALDTVVAGLVGSVATVLITKLLDAFQESRKHHYALRQAYFQRKLGSAEVAARQWHLYSTASGVFESLAKRWETDPRRFSSSDVDLLGAAISKQVADIRAASLDPGDSVRLYFELDHPGFWDSGPLRTLSEHFAALDVLEARARDMRKYFGPGIRAEASFHESVAKEFFGMQKEVHLHLKAIAAAYSELTQAAGNALKRVRANMRTFDT